jgi:hypothetical protein
MTSSSFRTLAASVALSLSLVLASSAAFAGEKAGHGLAFPVAGATFKQKADARIEKRRTRLEERITKKNLPADQAAQLRARFAEKSAKISAAVDQAVADGTVTKEEAQAIRKIAKGDKHGKRGAHGKKARAGQTPA